MQKNYKISLILSIIATALFAIITLKLITITASAGLIDTFIDSIVSETETMIESEEMFTSEELAELADILYSAFRMIYYSIIVISSGLIIASTLFIAFTYKHSTVGDDTFQEKRKSHVWFLIVIALCHLNVKFSGVFTLSDSYYFFARISSLAYLGAFIFICIANKQSKEAYSRRSLKTNQEYYSPSEKKIDDDVIDVTAEPENKPDLDELYSKLAKLENEYKNGLVSKDEYKEEKQKLLDKYAAK